MSYNVCDLCGDGLPGLDRAVAHGGLSGGDDLPGRDGPLHARPADDDLPLPDDALPAGSGCRQTRRDGWTIERQQSFIDDLGDHGNVTRAAGAVGMSVASAYRLRGREAARNGGRDGAFGTGWRAATAMAYQRLLDVALERIENGVVTTVFYKGEFAGTKLVYSDRLLLGMLNHLKPATPGGTVAVDPVGDPAQAYATAMDAYAVAVETGTAPVMPAAIAPAPAEPSVKPSPGEGPYHELRAHAARVRLAHGEDPYVPRFPGRIYPPHPDDCWVEAYPDGLTADDLAHEDSAELALVGLNRDGTVCDDWAGDRGDADRGAGDRTAAGRDDEPQSPA